MTLDSPVYQRMKITEPVLLELIDSKPVQRLKRIHNAGYHLVAGNFRDQTRYEHSIGVMQLLRMYDASLDEQIAGLLHDISHTAFSHVSTYVLREKYDGTEFHELKRNEFIFNTEIPHILKKHTIDLEYVLDDTHFKLLENELPDICADRIDYSLRDGLIWQATSKDKVRAILEGLTVNKGSFVFNDKTAARYFSDLFFDLNQMLYGSPYNAYFNYKFGELIKYAISTNVIKEQDWFKDDYFILEKLKKSTDQKIERGLQEFNGKLMIFEDNDKFDYEFSKKLRTVDPPVLIGKSLKRLSELDPSYRERITKYKKDHPEWKLKIKTFLRE